MCGVNSFPLSAWKVFGIPPAPFTHVLSTAKLTSLALLLLRRTSMTNLENPSIIMSKYLKELIFSDTGPTKSRFLPVRGTPLAPSFKFTPCFSKHVAHWSTNFFVSSHFFPIEVIRNGFCCFGYPPMCHRYYCCSLRNWHNDLCFSSFSFFCFLLPPPA